MLTQLRRFLSILKCWIRIRILRNVFRFQNRNKKYRTPNEKSIASRKKHPRRPILLLPLQVTNVSCRFTWYATPSRWAALGWVRWYWSINHELHEAQLLKINCSSALEALHYSTESYLQQRWPILKRPMRCILLYHVVSFKMYGIEYEMSSCGASWVRSFRCRACADPSHKGPANLPGDC